MSAQNISKQEDNDTTIAVNPKRFLLWLFIVAIIMLFAAFTSGYIVRRAEGNWMNFPMPSSMWVNTIIILLSSIPMIWAYRSAKQDQIGNVKTGLFITLGLGIAFLIGQIFSFYDLADMGIHLSASGSAVSGSFLIVIAVVHAIHIIGGLIWLCIVLFQTFQFKVHKKNILNISLCNTYWHFIGILWIYLFAFLYLYR